MGQYCFAGCRLSSSSVTLAACGPAGRCTRGNAAWEHCRPSRRRSARWRPSGRVGGQAADTARIEGQYGYAPSAVVVVCNTPQRRNVTRQGQRATAGQ